MTRNSPETGQQSGTTTAVGHRQCAGRWGEMLLNKKPSVLVVCALGVGMEDPLGTAGEAGCFMGTTKWRPSGSRERGMVRGLGSGYTK